MSAPIPPLSRCSSCTSSIRWAVSAKSGKPTPLSEYPPGSAPLGNVRLVGEIAHVLGPAKAAEARAAGERLWLSHFVDCPGAATHRKPKP